MKKLIFVLCLIASTSIHAQEQEKHFTQETEIKCTREVSTLGCGTPTDKNADTFIACVDKKVTSLTDTCREFHKSVKNFRHNHQH